MFHFSFFSFGHISKKCRNIVRIFAHCEDSGITINKKRHYDKKKPPQIILNALTTKNPQEVASQFQEIAQIYPHPANSNYDTHYEAITIH